MTLGNWTSDARYAMAPTGVWQLLKALRARMTLGQTAHSGQKFEHTLRGGAVNSDVGRRSAGMAAFEGFICNTYSQQRQLTTRAGRSYKRNERQLLPEAEIGVVNSESRERLETATQADSHRWSLD